MFTGLAGIIAGLFGTAVTKYFEAKDKQTAHEMQKDINASNERIANIEIEKVKLTVAANKSIAQSESESKITLGSFTHDSDIGKEPDSLIGFIRKVIRPYLTIAFSSIFLYWVWYLMTPDVAKIHMGAFIGAFIELTVAIVLWWFGIRPAPKS
jgi:hypothetical protein